MSYSIAAIIQPYEDKQGLSKVLIQVIYNRMKVYAPTVVKVEQKYFEKGQVVKHKEKKWYNDIINEQRHNIEKKLLDRLRDNVHITKPELDELVKGKEKKNTAVVFEYIHNLIEQLNGKLSDGRLKHYAVIANKIERHSPGLVFGSVSIAWINEFEAWLRNNKTGGNTVLSNMSLLISIFNKAAGVDLIKEKQFKDYKRPRYVQKLVEYLLEPELDKIKAFVDIVEKPSFKQAGYYFLLSSLTGYRIGDARRFNYDEMVKDGQIVIRAGKNGKIVSIPVYPRLQIILEYIKDNPLTIADQTINDYLKEIAKFCGIKKHLHYHISRHSFAMMLIRKGFSIDEVAIMLGDSVNVARVYAQISNIHLSDKVLLLLS